MPTDPVLLELPAQNEYASFYHRYIAAVEGSDVQDLLRTQPDHLLRLCGGLTEERALYRYAPGKWSIKQVIGHVTDTERVFAYRLLRFARLDPTPLSGFDEGLYVQNGAFDGRPVNDLLEEFRTVREATLALLRGLAPDARQRSGEANGARVSVRAIAYLIPAHAEHHLRMLNTHYGLRTTD